MALNEYSSRTPIHVDTIYWYNPLGICSAENAITARTMKLDNPKGLDSRMETNIKMVQNPGFNLYIMFEYYIGFIYH